MTMAKTNRRHRSTALLIIDFINHFRFPDGVKLARRAVSAARATAALKAHLRERGCPCIYANDNFGAWNSEFSELIVECERQPGPSADIVALLRPGRDDLRMLKPRHSAFYGTPLEFILEELGTSTLIIAGIAVDMCVMATAQDAHMRKFKMSIPANCIAGFNAAHEKTALEVMARTLRVNTTPYRHRSLRGRTGE